MAAVSATTTAGAGASGAACRHPACQAGGGRVVVLVGRLFLGCVLVRLDHVDLDLEVHFQVFELGGVDDFLSQINITGVYVSVYIRDVRQVCHLRQANRVTSCRGQVRIITHYA